MDESNPKDLIGVTKPPLDLIPPASKIYQAIAMKNGSDKYGPFNFRQKKVKASIYLAACQRHMDQWMDGEENASDSGVPHLAHAIACLGILIDALETGNLIDDRPPKGCAAKLIEKFTKKKE